MEGRSMGSDDEAEEIKVDNLTLDKNPIMDAIKKNSADDLLDALFSEDKSTRSDIGYALKWSCLLGMDNCFEVLFEVGVADLFFKDALGDNALFWACFDDNPRNLKIVEQLINVHAKEERFNTKVDDAVAWLVKCVNTYGETALHSAARSGSLEMVKLLLHNGADPTKENRYKQLPCHFTIPNTRIWHALRSAARKWKLNLYDKSLAERNLLADPTEYLAKKKKMLEATS